MSGQRHIKKTLGYLSIFSHLMLWIAVARHNVKWLKIEISELSVLRVKKTLGQRLVLAGLGCSESGSQSWNGIFSDKYNIPQ